MGSSGYGFQLERVSGKATDARLKSVVLNTLLHVWGGRRQSFLPYEWRHFACDWICLGEDSLLTIDASDGYITFWFYDSVGWSIGLAHHWLMLTLAVRRGEFEAAFARIGFRINPENWPEVKQQMQSTRHLFFQGDGGIGELSDDGVYWQVKNGNYEVPSTPIEELSADARSEMDKTIADKRCRCPLCKSVWSWKPEPADVPGFQAKREAVFVARSIGAVDVSPEGMIVSTGERYEKTWTGRTASLDQRWSGIVELSNPDRHLDAILKTDDALVAHAFTNSGARYLSISKDGGQTWSEQAPQTAFGKAKKVRLFPQSATSDVYAAAEPAKALFCSTDGGQTFAIIADSLQLEGKPIAAIENLAVHEGHLFAVLRLKRDERVLVVSKDRDLTFRGLDVPKNASPQRVVCHSGVIACVLQQGTQVLLMRSTDYGETFSLHMVGSGLFTSIAVGPKGWIVGLHEYRGGGPGGIFVSSDGVAFAQAAKHVAPNVFADPTERHLGFFFSEQGLYSLDRA